MHWSGWPLERLLILFVGAAYILIGVQVTMSHYRQQFHHKAMLAPVIASPLFVISGVALAFSRSGLLLGIFTVLMWIGVVAGMGGLYYHLHGVGVRVGGFAGRNFLVGPPVVMPVVFTAMAALGLIAVYWG
ncbi:hypothetical protein [Paenibacillus cymbidii]|uniref:hypothetical protein n=1 Tax=Paenibacillus cymbidii TaxID=1639034 RepID=UPI00107FFFB5|nr:hypothetical protein [Paenibacillus cymbidii]